MTQLTEEQVLKETGGEVVETDIFDIKKEFVLLPPEVNVAVKIYDISKISTDKDGNLRDWRMFVPKFQLINHIDIGGEKKFKGAIVSGKMHCYFASESKYDYTKPFYSKQQFLVELANIARAIDLRLPLTKEGATEESIDEWIEGAKGKTLLISIKQVPVEEKNPETGKYEPTEELQNVATNYKRIPEEMLI